MKVEREQEERQANKSKQTGTIRAVTVMREETEIKGDKTRMRKREKKGDKQI